LPSIEENLNKKNDQELKPTRAASIVEILKVKNIKEKMIIYRLRYFDFDHQIIEKCCRTYNIDLYHRRKKKRTVSNILIMLNDENACLLSLIEHLVLREYRRGKLRDWRHQE